MFEPADPPRNPVHVVLGINASDVSEFVLKRDYPRHAVAQLTMLSTALLALLLAAPILAAPALVRPPSEPHHVPLTRRVPSLSHKRDVSEEM